MAAPDDHSLPNTGFRNITTATTTVVKAGPGILQSLVINTTAAGTITIYDNTSAAGTKIATIAASANLGDYVYNCVFSTGLTVVTAAASDVTVTYV